jgi:hypothetical protein
MVSIIIKKKILKEFATSLRFFIMLSSIFADGVSYSID